MKSLVEKLVLKLLRSLITDEVIKQAKAALIGHLRALAKRTDTKVDDVMVDILEEALDVEEPLQVTV